MMKVLFVRDFDDRLHRAVTVRAAERGMPLRDAVEEAVKLWLKVTSPKKARNARRIRYEVKRTEGLGVTIAVIPSEEVRGPQKGQKGGKRR